MVDCQDGYGIRIYGKYVGFSVKTLTAIIKSLPQNWLAGIEGGA